MSHRIQPAQTKKMGIRKSKKPKPRTLKEVRDQAADMRREADEALARLQRGL